MKSCGTLFLHGYGVRGRIWRTVRTALGVAAGPTEAPDLEAASIDDLVVRARGRAKRLSLEQDAPILVVGHSLGAVLAGLTALDPGPPQVGGVVLIAPPYGEREQVPGPLLRFLLRHRLLPPALIRPRFFSEHTPEEIQKEVFAHAVPEAPELQQITFERRFFHTDLFSGPLPVPSLVLASEADRIVPATQSKRFASLLGSELVILPEREGVGHDDFFASPEIAGRTAEIIAGFNERPG